MFGIGLNAVTNPRWLYYIFSTYNLNVQDHELWVKIRTFWTQQIHHIVNAGDLFTSLPKGAATLFHKNFGGLWSECRGDHGGRQIWGLLRPKKGQISSKFGSVSKATTLHVFRFKENTSFCRLLKNKSSVKFFWKTQLKHFSRGIVSKFKGNK